MERRAGKLSESMKWLLLMAAFALFLSGCASFMTRPSVSEIVQMSQDGVPSSEIITKIKKNGSVYYLSDEEIEKLQKQGVPYTVTSYMRETRDQAMAQEGRRQMYYDTWIRDPVSGVF